MTGSNRSLADGGDGRDHDYDDHAPLTDVFDLVGHETRTAIVATLGEYDRTESDGSGLSFSTLRERVGHDDPGNFNYHLQRLVGGPVEKTDAGYTLSRVGHRLLAVVVSDRFDPETDTDLRATTDCPVCGDSAPVRYTDGCLEVECSTHSATLDVGSAFVDRVGVSRAYATGYWDGVLDCSSFRRGICRLCEGRTDGGLVERGDGVRFEAICRQCGHRITHVPAGCVLDHPAVVALCWDHDVDVREDAARLTADHADSEVVQTDPLRVDVRVTVGDDSVVVTLDDDATVCGVVE
ncbi:hypothetical protein RYH80_15860 [Halobaculum sp. MBLA0147]|uniref:DUF7351 domain-containing protein n=1 Tax=Halobaculum sp. MBLA0147 TaxID=3079934 RepID=UPI003523E459